MPRRTKIVATLGPATDDDGVLDAMLAAGLDVVRLNLSHDTHDRHRARAEQVRRRAPAFDREVGILIDLQGPKIRIGRFRDGPISLSPGDTFSIELPAPWTAGIRSASAPPTRN